MASSSRGVTVKITGEEELLRKLKALEDVALGSMLTEAVSAAAQLVVVEAKARAPVRTGNLREAIEAGEPKRVGFRVTAPIGPGKKGWYGLFVEVGTKLAAAHPFLRPALDGKRKEIKQTIREIVRQRIEKVARS